MNKQPLVAWKIWTTSASSASARIRGMLPAYFVEKHGWQNRYYTGANKIDFYEGPEVVVFVKSVMGNDLRQAEMAYKLGIPIIVDICDDIFFKVESEEHKDTRFQPVCDNFLKMCRLATYVVVTGEALAEKLRARIENPSKVVIIPDMIDISSDMDFINNFRDMQRKQYYLGHGLFWLLNFALPDHLLRRNYAQLFARMFVWYFRDLPRRKYNQAINTIRKKVKKFPKSRDRFVRKSLRGWRLLNRLLFLSAKQREQFRRMVERENLPSRFQPVVAKPIVIDERKPVHLLWFGNAGTPGLFGITDLLQIKEELVKLSEIYNLRLTVVSNDPLMFKNFIAPLPVKTAFRRWDVNFLESMADSVDVLILPYGNNDFARCKSNNRAILAFMHDIPVVCSKIASMSDFADCSIQDDWIAGVQTYVENPELKFTHIEKAKEIISSKYSPEVIGAQWSDLLTAARVVKEIHVEKPVPSHEFVISPSP